MFCHNSTRNGRAACVLVASISVISGPCLGQESLDRTVLPIHEQQPKAITTLDARDAKAPPRFEVKAPEGVVDPEQELCHQTWRDFGALVYVVRSRSDARAAVQDARRIVRAQLGAA